MRPINWTPIFEKYPGKWVAFDKDQETVIFASKSAKKAYDRARKKGVKIPYLFKVPIEFLPYVGGFTSR